MLTALLALAVVCLQEAPATQTPAHRGVGLRSLTIQSTLTLPEAPKQKQTIDWVLGFPARSRSERKDPHGPPGQRWLCYEYQAAIYNIGPQSQTSTIVQEPAATTQALHFALRRAAHSWPRKTPWVQAGEHWTCSLGALGSLRAEGADIDRPEALIGLDSNGKERIALRSIRWGLQENRLSPLAAQLWSKGALTWSENLDSARARVRVVKAFFLPNDRRKVDQSSRNLVIAIRMITLGPQWVWTRRLSPSETKWTAIGAWSEIKALEHGLTGTGWQLDPIPDLILDQAGQPLGLRWTANGGQPGKSDSVLRTHGWSQTATSSGHACPLASFEDLHPSAWLETKRSAGPPGKSGISAFLRRKRNDAGKIVPLELILTSSER